MHGKESRGSGVCEEHVTACACLNCWTETLSWFSRGIDVCPSDHWIKLVSIWNVIKRHYRQISVHLQSFFTSLLYTNTHAMAHNYSSEVVLGKLLWNSSWKHSISHRSNQYATAFATHLNASLCDAFLRETGYSTWKMVGVTWFYPSGIDRMVKHIRV